MAKMQIFEIIEQAIKRPPIPHDPYKQSLKAWAMYCLRDRGFKVVYAQNADFAIESKASQKLYFKVANSPENLDPKFGWIIWDSTTKTASFIPPQSQ